MQLRSCAHYSIRSMKPLDWTEVDTKGAGSLESAHCPQSSDEARNCGTLCTYASMQSAHHRGKIE
jgi:hypothetical protein